MGIGRVPAAPRRWRPEPIRSARVDAPLRLEPAMTEIQAKDRAATVLERVLRNRVVEVYGHGSTVANLTKLSGGASRETWSFDVTKPDGATVPLILKRDPVLNRENVPPVTEATRFGVSRATEGRLIELAGEAGVPVPNVPFYLEENEHTTAGFIMQRLPGEALGRRILRDDAFAAARPKLAFQSGHAAARLHRIPLAELPVLRSMNVEQELDFHHHRMLAVGHPYPGFEYGFRWLKERFELAGDRHALVHGDFRNGNLLIDREGLRGVLDWESAHLGNPLFDLGWICVRSWRYGHLSKPVGGFGEIEDLQEGYQAGGGGRVNADTIRYWEVFGTVVWGVLCITMAFSHRNGARSSIEKAVIGRRSAETEYDLLQVID